MKYLLAVFLMVSSQSAFGFSQKKMDLREVKGVTETQVAPSVEGNKMSLMVRGKGAEFLFRSLKEKRQEKVDSKALEIVGALDNTHWTVEGRQVTCSRIHNKKSKKEDYACAFDLQGDGKLVASAEPFTPTVFNLAKTKTDVKFFKKKAAARGLASASPAGPQDLKAYAMYEGRKNEKPEFKDTMFVFRGAAATQIMDFLQRNAGGEGFSLAGAKGYKGREISCVESTAAEPARCAIVVSLAEGFISTRKNPLFR